MTIKVVIADDQTLVRAGFKVLVNSAHDLEVVGEASNGEEALSVVASTNPDVVLMDIRMPVMDGIEATQRIIENPLTRNTRILILTTFELDEYVFEALRSGASGFLLKDTPPEDLLSAIRVIAGGEALLAPSITKRLIAEFARWPESNALEHTVLDSLTDREREVMIEIANGYSNAEIAKNLHMSIATVKTHVSRTLAKLEARDRTQLVVLAYQTGLVKMPLSPK